MDIPPTDWLPLLWPMPLLMFGFWLVFTGRLVSSKHLDRLQRLWEARIAEKDLVWEARLSESHEREVLWQQAHAVSEETRSNVAAQMETLRINSEVAVRVLSSLPGTASISEAVHSITRGND